MDNYKIVVADVDDETRKLIVSFLFPLDFNVFTAKDGQTALSLIENEKPDILITAVDLPYITGYSLCEKIKNNNLLNSIYVIIITETIISNNEISEIFDYGTDAYISKPINNKELLGKIKAALKIKTLQNEVIKLSIIDELTGIYNRKYFEQVSNNEFYRAERYHRPLSCIIIDIDNLKNINETFGYDTGDQVLINISTIVKNNIRRSDSITLCRYSGEEFIVLLPETDTKGALACAENLKKQVAETKINFKNNEIYVTISIGISSFSENPVTNTKDIIRYANEALSKAKEAGKNCIIHISK